MIFQGIRSVRIVDGFRTLLGGSGSRGRDGLLAWRGRRGGGCRRGMRRRGGGVAKKDLLLSVTGIRWRAGVLRVRLPWLVDRLVAVRSRFRCVFLFRGEIVGCQFVHAPAEIVRQWIQRHACDLLRQPLAFR